MCPGVRPVRLFPAPGAAGGVRFSGENDHFSRDCSWKKPDRPAVKLPPKSVPVPSVSPSYNNTPLSPRIPGVTVNRVAVPDKVVALTFDDGPHGTLTPRVLDILRDNNVKGTFFMQGCNVKAHPQVVRRMVNEGHEVGNHTWNHVYLSKVPREKAESQLQSTNEAIRNACGVVPVVMRPPRRLYECRRGVLGPPALRLHHGHVGCGHE